MSDFWDEDPVTNIIGVLCLVGILFCLLGLGMSIKHHHEQQVDLRVRHCSLVKEEKTGKRVYCGKACSRDELKYTYTCQVEPKHWVIVR